MARSYDFGPPYSYISQNPRICSGTVRDNMVFGLPVDAARLDQDVDACALGPDLAFFPHDLDTNVDQAGGNRLSDGQCAQIALARAAYRNVDVYLLDDPLAALDAHVGERVRDQCLFDLLADKTRLISAHQHTWFTSKLTALAYYGASTVESFDSRSLSEVVFSVHKWTYCKELNGHQVYFPIRLTRSLVFALPPYSSQPGLLERSYSFVLSTIFTSLCFTSRRYLPKKCFTIRLTPNYVDLGFGATLSLCDRNECTCVQVKTDQ
ncbi:hypothetical protein FBUS_08998 [Fasciolopsis buskii]|uniref:ABC transporter domain-containing protein n=1 Tax=Fasciolopsis buskii TaxID=27845 RepID=A0A8E0VE59_9TREM|nr:hypothetical protein FBUS_08998 [Fasciolopsis buski]